MKYIHFSLGNKKSAIEIKADTKYDQLEAFYNPHILKKNNTFKVYKGKKEFDLVGYQDPYNFAISGKVKDLLLKNNITGWDCYPIIIEGINSDYYGFHITGKAGPITSLDEDGDPMHDRTEFDISTWDGSDIFSLENTAIKVCIIKVKEILEKAKITNIEFVDLDKY